MPDSSSWEWKRVSPIIYGLRCTRAANAIKMYILIGQKYIIYNKICSYDFLAKEYKVFTFGKQKIGSPINWSTNYNLRPDFILLVKHV